MVIVARLVALILHFSDVPDSAIKSWYLHAPLSISLLPSLAFPPHTHPCFRSWNNGRGPALISYPIDRERNHVLYVHRLRKFNPHLPYGYHAKPLDTVLSDFPRPYWDFLTDDILMPPPERYKPPAFANTQHYQEIPEDWWPSTDPSHPSHPSDPTIADMSP